MPTGYTATLVEHGQTFPEFAMQCAKAFGACITLRDEPFDAPIPTKFKASTWHTKQQAKARALEKRLGAMNKEERLAFGQEKRALEATEAAKEEPC